MIIRILIVVLVAALVFWLVKKTLPILTRRTNGRILPWLVSPMVFPILRRAIILAFRVLFRR